MAGNKMSGNLMGLKIGGTFISCETSCEFNFEADLKGASPTEEGRWKEWLSGAVSWNIALNAALLIRMAGTGANTILNAFLTGERLLIAFSSKRADMPNLIISGGAYVQNGSLGAAVNSKAGWNVTLMGDGPFTAEINTNMVFAIATDTTYEEVLDGGGNNLLVGANGTS